MKNLFVKKSLKYLMMQDLKSYQEFYYQLNYQLFMLFLSCFFEAILSASLATLVAGKEADFLT